MNQGRVLRFLVVFLSGFLATTTSVYAAHFAAAVVESHIITSATSETVVQFSFLGALVRPINRDHPKPVMPIQFQCTVVHQGKPTSFRLFTSAKEVEPFTVKTETDVITKITKDTITMTGKVLSHLVFVSGRDVRLLTEVADFKAVGVDVEIPEDTPEDISADVPETFVLEFTYRYSARGIGALLDEVLPDLVTCDDAKDTCTLKLEGKVEQGEIDGHTASGD